MLALAALRSHISSSVLPSSSPPLCPSPLTSLVPSLNLLLFFSLFSPETSLFSLRSSSPRPLFAVKNEASSLLLDFQRFLKWIYSPQEQEPLTMSPCGFLTNKQDVTGVGGRGLPIISKREDTETPQHRQQNHQKQVGHSRSKQNTQNPPPPSSSSSSSSSLRSRWVFILIR